MGASFNLHPPWKQCYQMSLDSCFRAQVWTGNGYRPNQWNLKKKARSIKKGLKSFCHFRRARSEVFKSRSSGFWRCIWSGSIPTFRRALLLPSSRPIRITATSVSRCHTSLSLCATSNRSSTLYFDPFTLKMASEPRIFTAVKISNLE